jgi:hypothetical protein
VFKRPGIVMMIRNDQKSIVIGENRGRTARTPLIDKADPARSRLRDMVV